jgi:hypothetical protein
MTEDAQREMEQRSLRNVRTLLDKLEDDAAGERRARRWLVIGMVASAAVLFGVAFFGLRPGKSELRTIVVQPAGRTAPAAASPSQPAAQ